MIIESGFADALGLLSRFGVSIRGTREERGLFNLKKIKSWTSKAARANADIILFPELAISGHWCNTDSWAVSQEVPGGSAVKQVLSLAKKHGVYISVGLGERDMGVQYNCQVLVGPGGYIGKQRKLNYFQVRVSFVDNIKIALLMASLGE